MGSCCRMVCRSIFEGLGVAALEVVGFEEVMQDTII